MANKKMKVWILEAYSDSVGTTVSIFNKKPTDEEIDKEVRGCEHIESFYEKEMIIPDGSEESAIVMIRN